MSGVLVYFQLYRDQDLLAKGREIYKSLNGNANFPSPTVPLTIIDTCLHNFSEALIASTTGLKTAIAGKNALRATLVDMLSSNGNYVNSVAKGNIEKLVSSGYTLRKEGKPAIIETPVIKKIEQGNNPGEIIVKATNQRAVKCLEFQWAKATGGDNLQWQSRSTSRSKLTITNLEQGQQYLFRVVATGSNNQRLYGKPVSAYLLMYSVANAA